MTTERTEPQHGPAPDGQGRLAEEHALDQAALARTLPEKGEEREGPPAAPVSPSEGPTRVLPPTNARLGRRTRVLGALVAGAVLFLAGIQCQKLTGGAPPGPGETETTATQTTTAPVPVAPATQVVYGEITAIRGPFLYVREGNGHVVRVRTGGATRTSRGSPASRAGVAPGETVVAELQAPGGAPATAISVTVLPSRSSARP